MKTFDINKSYSEDIVEREYAAKILGLDKVDSNKIIAGIGQRGGKLGSSLGQIVELNKVDAAQAPDFWYFPKNTFKVAVVGETKGYKPNSPDFTKSDINQIKKYLNIVSKFYNKVIGILYNGGKIMVYKYTKGVMEYELLESEKFLQPIEYYINLFDNTYVGADFVMDKAREINDALNFDFKVEGLKDRWILTSGAILAELVNENCLNGHNSVDDIREKVVKTLSKKLERKNSRPEKDPVELLLKSLNDITFAVDGTNKSCASYISNVQDIANMMRSNNWNSDMSGLLFNEFTRYNIKADMGQILTPPHIASFMCKLLDLQPTDNYAECCCGTGGQTLAAATIMTDAVGGIQTVEGQNIIKNNIFMCDLDKGMCSMAYTNAVMHKMDAVEILPFDATSEECKTWLESHKINKMSQNPPYERKNHCIEIVENTLSGMVKGGKAVFLLPCNKLDKSAGVINRILEKNTLDAIIKLPENIFHGVGVQTSLFVFTTGIAHGKNDIFTTYIEDDGLVLVKNRGRCDIKNAWPAIEAKYLDIVKKKLLVGNSKWISPAERLSYKEEVDFEINKYDFVKTIMDYTLYTNGIDSNLGAGDALTKFLFPETK